MTLLHDTVMLVKTQSRLSETKPSPINKHQEQLGSTHSSLVCVKERVEEVHMHPLTSTFLSFNLNK